VGQRAATLNLLQLLQQLPLLDRLRGWINRGRLLLRLGRSGERRDQPQKQSGDEKSKRCVHRRHSVISLFPWPPDGGDYCGDGLAPVAVSRVGQDAIVSR